MAAIETLLFDLGGVVLGIDFGRVFAHWAQAAGMAPQEVARRFEFGDDYLRHERGELDDAGFFRAASRAAGLGLDVRQMADGWSRIFTGPVPGMSDMLARLSPRWPLYLFSNTNPAHHVQWSQAFAAEIAPFRRLFLSHELGVRKPEPQAFRAVADAIGTPPERILFFDDTLVNVEGARAVGMPAEQVRCVEDLRRALALHGVSY